jgi:hypothetical protein
MMTKILWVSRHVMTEDQINDLNRIYGEYSVDQWDAPVGNVNELIREDIDVYAVVLPLPLQSSLLNALRGTKPLIISKMDRVPCGTQISATSGVEETAYKMIHDRWEQIDRIVVESHTL